MSFYSREAIHRARAAVEARGAPTEPAKSATDVPPDAPMDDATVTVWDGARFVAYEKWLATAPLVPEEKRPQDQPAIPADAACVSGDCGGTRIWLVREGGRWLMYVACRRPAARRKDFASPYVEHAMRTAEAWYGAPRNGWCAEKGRDEKRIHEGASVHPQDPDHGESARE